MIGAWSLYSLVYQSFIKSGGDEASTPTTPSTRPLSRHLPPDDSPKAFSNLSSDPVALAHKLESQRVSSATAGLSGPRALGELSAELPAVNRLTVEQKQFLVSDSIA